MNKESKTKMLSVLVAFTFLASAMAAMVAAAPAIFAADEESSGEGETAENAYNITFDLNGTLLAYVKGADVTGGYKIDKTAVKDLSITLAGSSNGYGSPADGSFIKVVKDGKPVETNEETWTYTTGAYADVLTLKAAMSDNDVEISAMPTYADGPVSIGFGYSGTAATLKATTTAAGTQDGFTTPFKYTGWGAIGASVEYTFADLETAKPGVMPLEVTVIVDGVDLGTIADGEDISGITYTRTSDTVAKVTLDKTELLGKDIKVVVDKVYAVTGTVTEKYEIETVQALPGAAAAIKVNLDDAKYEAHSAFAPTNAGVTINVGGSPLTAADYTYARGADGKSFTVTIPAAKVTGAIAVAVNDTTGYVTMKKVVVAGAGLTANAGIYILPDADGSVEIAATSGYYLPATIVAGSVKDADDTPANVAFVFTRSADDLSEGTIAFTKTAIEGAEGDITVTVLKENVVLWPVTLTDSNGGLEIDTKHLGPAAPTAAFNMTLSAKNAAFGLPATVTVGSLVATTDYTYTQSTGVIAINATGAAKITDRITVTATAVLNNLTVKLSKDGAAAVDASPATVQADGDKTITLSPTAGNTAVVTSVKIGGVETSKYTVESAATIKILKADLTGNIEVSYKTVAGTYGAVDSYGISEVTVSNAVATDLATKTGIVFETTDEAATGLALSAASVEELKTAIGTKTIPVTFVTPAGKVVMSGEDFKAIISGLGTADLTVSTTNTVYNGAILFDIEVDYGGTEVNSFSGLQVSLPVDAAPEGKKITLQHVINEITFEYVEYTYADGTLSFTTDGLSQFVVGYVDVDAPGSSDGDGNGGDSGNTMYLIAVAVLAVLLVVVLVYFLFLKK